MNDSQTSALRTNTWESFNLKLKIYTQLQYF